MTDYVAEDVQVVQEDPEQIERASRLIVAVTERRQQACMEQIQRVLKQYGCELIATCIISNGTIVHTVRAQVIA